MGGEGGRWLVPRGMGPSGALSPPPEEKKLGREHLFAPEDKTQKVAILVSCLSETQQVTALNLRIPTTAKASKTQGTLRKCCTFQPMQWQFNQFKMQTIIMCGVMLILVSKSNIQAKRVARIRIQSILCIRNTTQAARTTLLNMQ